MTTKLTELEAEQLAAEEIELLKDFRSFLAHPFIARLEEFTGTKILEHEHRLIDEDDMTDVQSARSRTMIKNLKDLSHGRLYQSCLDYHRTMLRKSYINAARRRAATAEAIAGESDIGGSRRKRPLA